MARIVATPEANPRRGRPPLHETGRKRGYFNARLSDPVKETLTEDARSEGRSLSEEIEFRLRHSVDEQRALGGPRSAALFRLLVGIAGIEGGGTDWAADFATYNLVLNRWLEVLKDATPAMPDRIRRQIERGRVNVRRVEQDMAPDDRDRLIGAVENQMKDRRLPPEIREEFRRAATAARAKWGMP
jgi:hypothetical protein